MIQTKNNRKQNIDDGYRKCEQIMKKHSKSFYAAFSMLPRVKARAIYAIYAFCRLVDDVVDGGETAGEKRLVLEELEQALLVLNQGRVPERFPRYVWECLEDVNHRFEVNAPAFLLQIEGQKTDIVFEQPKTIDDLEVYCYQVASSVGLMMLPIIATKHYKELHSAAKNLGIAMQITNILRDIGEDFFEHGRIYLPQHMMGEFGVTVTDIVEKRCTTAFIALWEELAKIAEDKYHMFFEQADLFDADSRLQLLVAARIYKEILTAVRTDNYSFLTKKNFVSRKEKLNIIRDVKREEKRRK